MSRTGITLKEVAEAAETLQIQGENPTIDRVRTFLGGTGSNTTISKYLNAWRGQLPKLDQTDNASTPPDPVQIAVKRVWQQIREETDAEIKVLKAETQILIHEAEKEVHLATQEAEQLQTRCNELQQQHHALAAHQEIQRLDFKKLQEEHAQLQERHKNLDERYVDFQNMTAKHQTEIAKGHKNEIHHLIERSKAQECVFQKLLEELKIRHAEERERYRLEIDNLRTCNQRLEKEDQQLQSTIISKDLELRELKIQLNEATQEREKLSTQLSKQEKYWELFEKNSQLTKDIWSELKEIPKFDFSLSYINYFSEIQNSIDLSTDKLGKITDEAKSTLELFKHGNYVTTNHE